MTPLMVDVLLATLPMVAGGGHHLVSRMAKMEARCKDSSAPLPLRRIVFLRRSLECASGLAASGPIRSRGAHMVLQQAWLHLVRRGRSPMLRTDFQRGGAIHG